MSWALALQHAALHPVAAVPDASNVALVCDIQDGSATRRCVYKPVSGEQPLWDFPQTALAAREVLTAQIAGLLGWDLVPVTVWRDEGPMGPGICQEWVEVSGPRLVRLVEPHEVPEGWLTVASGRSSTGSPVVLAHADDPRLQRLAVLDVVVNNADRKGGHVLRTGDGRVVGIDHGLTFHADPKLRTVLWGWVGQPIPTELLAALESGRAACLQALDEEPLAAWITEAERTAFAARLDQVLSAGTFPEPGADWPTLPWPVL